ncbi:MAG: phosphoribosyl-ATP diphosphatase [Alphaproteobacteria bacterium]|nr:phosphoribosyl-ATP diphosphatase [Rickettsiales bacterium]
MKKIKSLGLLGAGNSASYKKNSKFDKAKKSHSTKPASIAKVKDLAVLSELRKAGKDGVALQLLKGFISSRKHADPSESYTAFLASVGVEEAVRILVDEAVQLALKATTSSTNNELLVESADLLFNILVLLDGRGISFSEIIDEIVERVIESGYNTKAFKKLKDGSLTEADLADYILSNNSVTRRNAQVQNPPSSVTVRKLSGNISNVKKSKKKVSKKAVAKKKEKAKVVAKKAPSIKLLVKKESSKIKSKKVTAKLSKNSVTTLGSAAKKKLVKAKKSSATSSKSAKVQKVSFKSKKAVDKKVTNAKNGVKLENGTNRVA